MDIIWLIKKITLSVVWRIDCRRGKVETETSFNTVRVIWARGDGGSDDSSKSRVGEK